MHDAFLATFLAAYYRNRSNFHGTNISQIPKMDSIYDFIFTNPPLYNIHEFVFALIEFDGAWHLPRVSSGFPFKFHTCGYQAKCTKLCLVHLKETQIMNKNTIIYDRDTHVVACCSRERGNRTKPLSYSCIRGNP